ncbi:MAG: hypothetical protein LCH54_15540 [Bacteroidetes bacterium]|nr:hypothetical protein [Bacteroidota bacterium]
MAQPKSKRVIKLEIRNVIAGAIGAAAFGTANLEIGAGSILKDSKGITFKEGTFDLSSGEKQWKNGQGNVDFKFTECQLSAGATEANILTDMNNGVRCQIKATYDDASTDVWGGTAGTLIRLTWEPKDGAKVYTLSADKDAPTRAALITEA